MESSPSLSWVEYGFKSIPSIKVLILSPFNMSAGIFQRFAKVLQHDKNSLYNNGKKSFLSFFPLLKEEILWCVWGFALHALWKVVRYKNYLFTPPATSIFPVHFMLLNPWTRGALLWPEDYLQRESTIAFGSTEEENYGGDESSSCGKKRKLLLSFFRKKRKIHLFWIVRLEHLVKL